MTLKTMQLCRLHVQDTLTDADLMYAPKAGHACRRSMETLAILSLNHHLVRGHITGNTLIGTAPHPGATFGVLGDVCAESSAQLC